MIITNHHRNWIYIAGSLQWHSDSSTWHQGPHGTTLQGDAMLWPYWCHQIPNHSWQPKKVPESMYQYTQHQVTSDNFSNVLKTRRLLGDKFHAQVYINNQFFDAKTQHTEASGTEVVDAIQSFSVRDGRSGLASCHWCLVAKPIGVANLQGKKYDTITLQGINISHLGKRKIIFKMPFLGDMLVSWRVIQYRYHPF